MCPECDNIVRCRYCGTSCYGTCSDPETCPACWPSEHLGKQAGEREAERCWNSKCDCDCHMDWHKIAPTTIVAEGKRDLLPFNPPGVFPLMKLPVAVRGRIYRILIRQSNKVDRVSVNFEGEVDTTILLTCRQIYREARDIPLTITKLSFTDAFHAFRFLAKDLTLHQRTLVKGFHLQINGKNKIHEPVFSGLIEELRTINLKHLSVTFIGAMDETEFAHDNLIQYYFLKLRSLESFNLQIGSGIITEKKKENIILRIKQRMIRRGALFPPRTLEQSGIHTTRYTSSSDRAKAEAYRHPAYQRLNDAYAPLAVCVRSFCGGGSLLSAFLKEADRAVGRADEKTFAEMHTLIMQIFNEKCAEIMQAREKAVLYLPGTSSQ